MLTTILSFTKKGSALGDKIKEFLPESVCYSKYYDEKGPLPIADNLGTIVREAFHNSSIIIFIGAAGIAVRSIAPYITTKDKDPAVIVIDEHGNHVIPILSGHLGGANRAALILAEKIGGQAVITTATDINHLFAVDVWADEQDLLIHNIENIKYISSALLKGDKIGFVCDYEVEGAIPEFITEDTVESGIVISYNQLEKPFKNTLYLSPRNYIIGIGCRKNTDEKVLEEGLISALKKLNISAGSLKMAATIDIKADEPAIKAFCNKYRLQLQTFTSEELSRAKGDFTPSEFVKNTVGVDNVCERAAFLGSNHGQLILRKTCCNGVTAAVAKKEWRCRF